MPRTFEDDLIDDARNGFVAEFSRVITYAVGRERITGLRATPVRPERAIDLEDTSPNESIELDWLIVAADLELDGVLKIPATGHKITATIGGVQMAFEALPRGPLPSWEWADSFQTMYRVRTKRVRVDG